MPIKQVGGWSEAELAIDKTRRDLPEALKKCVYQEASFFLKAMKGKLGSGVPPPLANPRGGGRNANGRFNKGGGGGTKPLNATGELKGSMTVLPEQPSLEAFIGIPRVARGHHGKVFSIAAIHENGAVIVMKMTAKQRGFLFGVLFPKLARNRKASKGATPTVRADDHPSKGILVIKIPARPFIQPTFDENAPGAPARFYARLAKLLGSKVGTP